MVPSQRIFDSLTDDADSMPGGRIMSDFPNELVDIIAAQLSREDLLVLRMTCKSACATFSHAFGQRLLKNRRFIFTEYSLQGLVEMTAHPVFSSCLRRISFGTFRLTKGSDNTEQHERASHQASFIQGDSHIRMIAQALENLKMNHNTSVILGVYDDFLGLPDSGTSRFTWCRNAYYRLAYGSNESYGSIKPTSHQLQATMLAIADVVARAHFPLEGLRIDASTNLQSMEDFRITDHAHSLQALFAIHPPAFRPGVNFFLKQHTIIATRCVGFHHIATVRFQVDRRCLTMHDLKIDDEIVEPMSTITFSRKHFGEIFEVVHGTNYNEIIIRRATIEMPAFVNLCHATRKALRRLVLYNIRLPKEPDGAETCGVEFLRCLKDSLPLDSLVLCGLQCISHSPLENHWVVQNKLSWTSKDEVQAGLEDLIEKRATFDRAQLSKEDWPCGCVGADSEEEQDDDFDD